MWILCGVLAAVAAAEVSGESRDARPEPADVVTRAFDRMLNYPSVRTIELRILRNGRVAGRRVFDVAYRKVEGRGHTILRFKEPEYLRDNALLMIEEESGENQTWLYQPEEARPRRVSTYQKSDAFYGSDLSFEDVENRRWQDYDLQYGDDRTAEGRHYLVVDARPRRHSPYTRASIWIERESGAIGRIEFYRREGQEPVKTMRVDLDTLREEKGLFIPKSMRFELTAREWSTEVNFLRVEVSPDIASRAFTTMRLQSEGEDLFDLVRRLGE